ncbi:hypothetical protein [Actinomadura madurae]|uniref:hypothetical protein n=1 Tax=Actinomadura madurae TaxID=1993 RepID=UPI0020D21F03|nr:hypothetical protein [Actinomadura madurae]MCP9971508.1 hypothetical protein [Actinomadura madurae]MCQ0020226.1 hypothetical protein [Actinomadura madurae]
MISPASCARVLACIRSTPRSAAASSEVSSVLGPTATSSSPTRTVNTALRNTIIEPRLATSTCVAAATSPDRTPNRQSKVCRSSSDPAPAPPLISTYAQVLGTRTSVVGRSR